MMPSDLLKFNEWWETGRVNGRKVPPYRRYLYGEVERFIKDRQMLLITGLRRVGKTCFMYQLIQGLLERKVEPRSILYFSFDEATRDIGDVLETYQREVLMRRFPDIDRAYIFFDEVQKAADWENKMKVYYDLHPNLKFFLSGSASLTLSKGGRESLAGRVYDFTMLPLTFREFLGIKGVRIGFKDARLFNEGALVHFADFLRKAGFPEIADQEDPVKIREYIRQSVIERVVYRDIPKQFGRADTDLLEKLTALFFQNPGMILNIENLSRDLMRDKKTLMNYIHYLRFSLLINLVSNYRGSTLASSRKNRKVYPATPAITAAYREGIDEVLMGSLMETAFCSEGLARYYYRRGGREVDFVLMHGDLPVPVEIKHRPSEQDIKAFAKALKELGVRAGLILSFKDFGSRVSAGTRIEICPLWLFLNFKEEVLKGLAQGVEGAPRRTFP